MWLLFSVNLNLNKIFVYNSDKHNYSEIEKEIFKKLSEFFMYYKKKAETIYYLNEIENLSLVKKERKGSNCTTDSSQNTSNNTPIKSDTTNLKIFKLNFLNIELENSFDSEQSIEDEDEWSLKLVNTPKVSRIQDSGVVVCKIFEYLSKNEPILFTENDVLYFRINMCIEYVKSPDYCFLSTL